MTPCPKPPPREKRPRKPLPRPKRRMAHVRKRCRGKAWTDVRREVLERANGRCEVDGCTRRASQAAHVHGLGWRHAGGRYSATATCPTCGCRLNDPSNLRAVCGAVHNDAVARPCPGRTP